MPKFVAKVVHKNTGREEYLIRESAAEHEARMELEHAGLVVRSLRPADFGGKGSRFEIRTPKGRVAGPFGPDILRAMVRDGNLTPHCSIRKTGDLDTHAWLPAWKAKGLFPGHVVDSIRRSHTVTKADDGDTAKLKAIKQQLDDGLIDEKDYRFKKGEIFGTAYEVEDSADSDLPDSVSIESTAFRWPERPEEKAPPRRYGPVIGIGLGACLLLVVGAFIGVDTSSSLRTAEDPSPTRSVAGMSELQSANPHDVRFGAADSTDVLKSLASHDADASRSRAHRIITLQQRFDHEFQRINDAVATDMMRLNEIRSAAVGSDSADLGILQDIRTVWASTYETLRDGRKSLSQIHEAIRVEVSGADASNRFDGLAATRRSTLEQLDGHIETARNEIASTDRVISHVREMRQGQSRTKKYDEAERNFGTFGSHFLEYIYRRSPGYKDTFNYTVDRIADRQLEAKVEFYSGNNTPSGYLEMAETISLRFDGTRWVIIDVDVDTRSNGIRMRALPELERSSKERLGLILQVLTSDGLNP